MSGMVGAGDRRVLEMAKRVRHTFVVCAYKESPYLEECLRSLLAQSVKSRILIVTSTPNEFIQSLAEQYRIPYFVNPGEGGITQDWNFGYACAAGSKYITIAHQDDVYEKTYLEKALRLLENSKRPLIFFSDYYEIREGMRVESNKLLKVKRLMLLPMRIKAFRGSRWVRRRILSLGSPICCPSVTYAADHLPKVIFQNGFRACEDWETWEMISKLSGDFLYSTELLMGHRIHADSETSAIIGDHKRTDEEYKMYCKFWPKPVAKLLARAYASGQKSNEL